MQGLDVDVINTEPHLHPQFSWASVGLQKVVGPPADVVQYVLHLPCFLEIITKLHNIPGKGSDGERHGQPELDIVAGVMVTPCKIHLPHMTPSTNSNSIPLHSQ